MSNQNLVNGIPLVAATVVDQRPLGSHRGESVGRFKKKVKKFAVDAVRRSISRDTLKDIADGKSIKGNIPDDSVKEYVLHKDTSAGGDKERVHPGNDQFVAGDKVARPPSGGGSGGAGEGDASDSGEGEDGFEFVLSKEEYLDILFEDLELPNLQETKIAKSIKEKLKRNGYSNSGSPDRLDVPGVVKKRMGHRIGNGERRLSRAKSAVEKTLAYANAVLEKLDADKIAELHSVAGIVLAAEMKLKPSFNPAKGAKLPPSVELAEKSFAACELVHKAKRPSKAKLTEWKTDLEGILDELNALIEPKRRASVLDMKVHGQYKNFDLQPEPSENAVMFCLMDVSGSMSQQQKDLAKRFYVLLYLFLERGYENVDVRFVRYHTQAKEVDEQEFFYGRETGGTVTSKGLELVKEIQEAEYRVDDWNIYIAHSTDGDNWSDDNAACKELATHFLQNVVRAYFYIEIPHRRLQDMYYMFESLQGTYPHMFLGEVRSEHQILPVFREFFLPKNKKA